MYPRIACSLWNPHETQFDHWRSLLLLERIFGNRSPPVGDFGGKDLFVGIALCSGSHLFLVIYYGGLYWHPWNTFQTFSTDSVLVKLNVLVDFQTEGFSRLFHCIYCSKRSYIFNTKIILKQEFFLYYLNEMNWSNKILNELLFFELLFLKKLNLVLHVHSVWIDNNFRFLSKMPVL